MLPAELLVCCRSACRQRLLSVMLLLSTYVCALVLIANSLHFTPQCIFLVYTLEWAELAADVLDEGVLYTGFL